MENRIIVSDMAMDAIDALIFLGFRIQKNPCNNVFVLVPTILYEMGSLESASIKLCFDEISDGPLYYNRAIKQKGIAYGN